MSGGQSSNLLMGHLIAFLTVMVWGTTFISTKILLIDFSPIEILFLRFLLGYIALWFIYPKWLGVKGVKQELMFAAAGLCGVTLYFLCENIALTLSSASNVGVIMSLSPLLTGLLAFIFLRTEKPNRYFFIGCLFAIIGVSLISLNGKFVLSLNPLGDILAVLACLCWAFYSILMKKISAYGYNTIQTTRRGFFYGLVLMLPALYIWDFHWGLERLLNPINSANLLFLGVGASAICFVTWNYALKRLGAVKISLYIYLVPIVAIVTAMLILNEQLTSLAAIGTALTLCGLAISEQKVKGKLRKVS